MVVRNSATEITILQFILKGLILPMLWLETPEALPAWAWGTAGIQFAVKRRPALRLVCDHTVAPLRLRFVEGCIRLLLQCFRGQATVAFLQDRDPDADGNVWANAGSRVRKRGGLHPASNSLRDLYRLLCIRTRKKNKKFFAAVTGNLVALVAQTALDNAGHLDKAAVAFGIAEAVIELFEMIDVTQQDRDPLGLLELTGSNAMKRLHHPAAIGDSCQCIGPSQQLQSSIGIGQIS